jgi:hypothetical protein
VGVATLSVKDFVIDVNKVKDEVLQKKKQKQLTEHIYEVVLQNNIDFVINRKTPTTNKTLVFLISQGTFYIKDNKTEIIDTLTEQKIRQFFQTVQYSTFDKLDKVQWWNRTPEYMAKLMIDIAYNETMQRMYQHGICVDKYKAESWKSAFENNIKLFKYCHDKCQESIDNKDSFDSILKLSTEIEKKINFNNAKYFIDKFCESSVKMQLYESNYRRDDTYIKFLNMIDTYNLNFNRYIDYICFDLYAQGIKVFSNDIMKEYEDYLRMQVSLYGEVKEKYSKHMRTDHDIVALKVSIYEKHKKDLMLLNVVDHFKNLEYKDKEYCIILPKTSMDIVDEGINQSHCVASYVDKVANNETLILFMRDMLEPEKSLVTIEVCNKTIVQAKGFGNRAVNDEEEKFIKKWAKAKELIYSKC